jgi:hypothetical protein
MSSIKLSLLLIFSVTIISSQSINTVNSYSFSTLTLNISIQEVNVMGRTYYDLQSNGICKQVWQDVNFPYLIHSMFMVDTTSEPGQEYRHSRYFLSNDTGNTWIFKRDIPAGMRSGFPCITSLSDGRCVILNHSTDGGNPLKTQIYIESSIGSGIFERKDPGSNILNDGPIWPVGITTSNLTNQHKIIYIAKYNALDTTFSNSLTGLTGLGSFSGYSMLPAYSRANSYSIARSGNRIGIVFIEDYLSGGNSVGSLYLIESTNSGITWLSPDTIWNANLALDSLGCFRSVDISYIDTMPKIFFLLCKRNTSTAYYNRFSKMMLWSPNINNGFPKTIDSAGGMSGFNGNSDYTSVSRGVIGTSSDNNLLFAAWCRARNDVHSSGNNYFDVWFSYSTDQGNNWLEKTQLTNNSGPLRDYRFPSISPFNKVNQDYYAHLIFQNDSIPGAYALGGQLSLAKMMYAKIRISGVLGISGTNFFTNTFTLNQNYPNPFNPTTKIRFSIPPLISEARSHGVRERMVNLIVYDLLGREVATLVNEQLKPGTYEADWDASNFAGGVYFYKLISADFSETKKMILVK